MRNRLAIGVLGALMSWGGWQILGYALEHGPALSTARSAAGTPLPNWDQPVGLSMFALGLMMVCSAWRRDTF
jgi:hypothetical protein